METGGISGCTFRIRRDFCVVTDSVSPPITQLGTAGFRCWRIILVLAILTVSVATHWPNLTLAPEAPSDKIFHAVTFGVLTFLFWRTHWLGSLWALALVMTAFAAIDERTQSLEWFHRQTSLEDWCADMIGIGVAFLLISQRSIAKGKSTLSQMRAALADAAEREMFCRPFTWIAMATSAALGVLVGVPLTVAVGKIIFRDQHPWQTAFLGGVLFAAVAIQLTWRSALRAAVLRIARERMCFCCGQHISKEDTALAGTCGSCGEKWRRAQWVPPAEVRRGAAPVSRRSLILFSLLGAIGIMAVLFFMQVTLRLGGNQWLSAEMLDLCSYAFAIVGIALILRFMSVPYRRHLANEGSNCLACGHDLQGTSSSSEVGICPECATEFVRIKA